MSTELKIQPVRYVIAVVDEGGFHAAARRLHRTQPAVSMAVRELEERLGQPLFEKGGKAMLTPFGEYVVPRLRDFLSQHDRLVDDVLRHAKGHSGQLDLATVPSVASRLMPDVLVRFMADHPGLDVNLHDENAEFVCRMVAEAEVELGVTSLWHPDDRLSYHSLFQDRIGLVCRRDHPLAQHDSLSWRALKGERLIRNGTSRLLLGSTAEAWVDNSTFFVSNMISLLAMLEAGAGLTTLPRLAFPEERDQLRFIPLEDPVLVRDIGLVTRCDRSLSPGAQRMVDILIERCASMGAVAGE